MLNKEKYAKEILDVTCRGERFALVENKIIPCNKTSCRSCYFYGSECGLYKEEWANSEYVEPPIDWSKVPVDTPVLVRESKTDKWKNRYFAMYRGGRICTWIDGSTSWSIESTKNRTRTMTSWKYAKLAEE